MLAEPSAVTLNFSCAVLPDVIVVGVRLVMWTVGGAANAGAAMPKRPADVTTAMTAARMVHARRCVLTPTPLPELHESPL
jgi:hypothetical protein